jgi:hypothetical protein
VTTLVVTDPNTVPPVPCDFVLQGERPAVRLALFDDATRTQAKGYIVHEHEPKQWRVWRCPSSLAESLDTYAAMQKGGAS